MPKARLDVRLKEDRCLAAHLEGRPWSEIAFDEGYREPSGAVKAADRALKRQTSCERIAALAEESEALLRQLMAAQWEIANRTHLVVDRGAVVLDPVGGKPLIDSGPRHQALIEVRRLSESLRKLRGADAPSRKVVEVVTDDVLEAEIRRLESDTPGLRVVS